MNLETNTILEDLLCPFTKSWFCFWGLLQLWWHYRRKLSCYLGKRRLQKVFNNRAL